MKLVPHVGCDLRQQDNVFGTISSRPIIYPGFELHLITLTEIVKSPSCGHSGGMEEYTLISTVIDKAEPLIA